MAGLMEYAAISAKTKALYRNVLSDDDYKQLLSKQSVREVAAYLKGYTHYDEMFKDIKQHDIHRGELEVMLTTSLAKEYSRLMNFCTGNQKRFLTVFVVGYEIELIKLAFRTCENDKQPKVTPPEYYVRHMTIDYNKLFEATGVANVIEQLKGTEYYKLLQPFTKETTSSLFNIEMSLDVYYYKYAWKLKDKLLAGDDNRQITDTLGSEIDILNLMFIVRSKQFFQTSKELLYAFILPIHYKIGKAMIKQIIEAPSMEETMRLIKTTPYNDLFVVEEGHYIEEKFLRFNFAKQYKRFRNEPFSIGSMMGYMHVKEIEVRNIIMIIEGIRYSQDRDVIENYIVKR